MKTFAVHTLGCKVNQYESQQVHQILLNAGLSAATPAQQPDIVIVNTCCVTHIASAKSRQKIRKAQKMYPKSSIIVTGCLPVGQDQELQNIQNIIIAKEKNNLAAIIDRITRDWFPTSTHPTNSKPINLCKIKDKNDKFSCWHVQKPLIPAHHCYEKEREPALRSAVKSAKPKTLQDKLGILTHYHGQCRAFLKIQDGCDAHCTYCIIPKIRTKVCNKPVKTVLLEAQNLIRSGHREIILTGIFLGAYGQSTARRKKWAPENANALADLLEQVAGLDGLARIRLSSLEPLDVTDRLLEVMTAYPNIMPHLHLPLQSGSANILRKMARQYTIHDYMRVIETVKSSFDRPAITTDIIVGFPGETEEDFNATVNIARQIGFAKIHVFSFSLRKNTPAEKMAKLFGAVSPKEIKRRSTILQTLDADLQEQFQKSCSGLQETVIVEKTRPPQGRCTRYFMVDLRNRLDTKNLKKGQLVHVTI